MSMHLRGTRRPVLPVFCALLVLGASVAQTTTVRRMTFSEVVDEAEIIAHGTVTAITATWDADIEMPFTQVTFSVLDVLKGDVDGDELVLELLGGPAPDGATLVVSGMPRFAVGDRAVVFSASNGLYACPLVGWWQGLYRVRFDDAAQAFTVADHVGRPVVAIAGAAGRMEARLSDGAAAADALTLDEFMAAVRSEAR